MTITSSWLTSIRHTLLGAPRCVLCHETAHSDGLCPACAADLHLLALDPQHACPGCAHYSFQAALCGQCQQRPPAYEALFAACVYTRPLRPMLHAFKYQAQSGLLPALNRLMLHQAPSWLGTTTIDAVLPMPLSHQRLAERGFNQSELLAAAVAHAYGWPLLDKSTVLRQHRPAQSTLSREQRLGNVRGIFRINANVKNRNLLLIDDVVTTGATVRELAQSLKRAGAASVYVWVLAHPQ